MEEEPHTWRKEQLKDRIEKHITRRTPQERDSTTTV